MTAYGIDFIDKDDAGRVLFALFEQIADTAGADAHEHFHEVRSGNRKEGYAGFSRDSASEEGFPGSGRADEQDAFGNAPAELLELLRLAEKFDDFLELLFGLFHSGNVLERHLFLLRGMQA